MSFLLKNFIDEVVLDYAVTTNQNTRCLQHLLSLSLSTPQTNHLPPLKTDPYVGSNPLLLLLIIQFSLDTYIHT